jgi:hypothetical protein
VFSVAPLSNERSLFVILIKINIFAKIVMFAFREKNNSTNTWAKGIPGKG